jgi:hypothetical protein
MAFSILDVPPEFPKKMSKVLLQINRIIYFENIYNEDRPIHHKIYHPIAFKILK